MARGPKSLYRPEYATQAMKLCLLLGATNEDLARFFGVSEPTIQKWQRNNEDFRDSIRQGKDAADANVASRLYQRAMGYDNRTAKAFGNPAKQAQMVVEYTERIPPDVTACIFWLKNRQPAMWRDRSVVRVEQLDELDNMTDEQLAAIASGRELPKS